ncbi:MarR family winged helix-turn-helix transcriptional regulator [Kiloniella litopenaei]|uniref:MarR family winged helix-turn-helix transcriptional regulator n=1 Tax=Kiloniella litopenaei TaxID=1549748 RepID=UPI003BAA5807
MTNWKMKSAGYLTNHMARLFFQGLRDEIAPLGIAPAQFMTLLELWKADDLTQKDLVERLDVEQATMANTITRMERDGLIERRPMPTDKRAKAIVATAKAKAIQKDAMDAAMKVNRSFLEVLSPEEQTQLLDLMRRIIENKTQSKG